MDLIHTRRWGPALLGAVLLLAADAFAEQAPTISLSAEANKVGVGEVLPLTIEVSAEGTKPQKIALPDFDGFEVVSKSISSPLQFSFGTGTGVKMTYTTRYELGLLAKKVGTHKIGPVIVTHGGKEFKSDTIVVEVTKEAQGIGTTPSPGGSPFDTDPFFKDPFKDFDDMFKRQFGRDSMPGTQPQPPPDQIPTTPPPEGLDGAAYDPTVFVRTVVSPSKVYIGQQATLEFYIYSRTSVTNIDVEKEPAGGKFWTKDLLPPTGNVDFMPAEIGGMTFNVATLRKIAIFPTEAGVQEIEPGKVNVSTGLGGIFGGETYERSGVPVKVEVLPLPAEGRPAGFNPTNVGTYTISVKLGAPKAVVDQPLPVQFVISGTGNIAMVSPPQVPFPQDVKVYDPTISDDVEVRHFMVGGKKKIEYIIMPTKAGKLVIPSASFSYFDPEKGRYETAVTDPLEVVVEPSSFAGTGPIVEGGSGEGEGGVDDKGLQGMRSIITVASLRPPSSQFIRSPWFVWAIAIPPALLMLLLVVSLVRFSAGRMKTRNPASRALGDARKALKASASAGDREAFYRSIQSAIYQYLERKLSIPASGMTGAELKKNLSECKIDAKDVDSIIQELENCEFARYGRTTDVRDDIKDATGRVNEILDRIDRQIQKGNGAPKNSRGKAAVSGTAAAVVLLAVLAAGSARAENVRQTFDRSNDLYFKGQYREAIEGYYGILNLGMEDPAVYFNTANAFAKLGEYGKAVYFYDKVLKIKPRDTATLKNLDIVRAALGRQISEKQRDIAIRPKETVWEGAVSWISPNESVIIFLFFYYLFFVLLLVRKFMEKQVSKIGVTIAIFFFLLLWVVAGAMVMVKYNVDFLRKEGVVVDRGLVAAREGPTEESNRKFDVAEGQLVQIRETRGPWFRVEDDKGREGWLQKSQLGIL